MPQAKRSYGKKRRSRGSSALNRAKALAQKYRYPLGAVAGAAGLYGLGKAYDRFAPENFVRGQFPLYYKNPDGFRLNIFKGRAGFLQSMNPPKRDDKGNEILIFRPYIEGGIDTGQFRAPRNVGDLIPSVRSIFKPKASTEEEEDAGDKDGGYGKRRRRRRRSSYKFGDEHKCHHNYGKRRRRRRSFGKAKKPSAATRRMCRKLKVKMTLKRGGKRVYKSEAMLKKQCKKAMKRKSKK